MIPMHLDKANSECDTINLTVLIDSLQNEVMMSRLLTWKMVHLTIYRKENVLFTAESMQTNRPPFIPS